MVATRSVAQSLYINFDLRSLQLILHFEHTQTVPWHTAMVETSVSVHAFTSSECFLPLLHSEMDNLEASINDLFPPSYTQK